MKRALISLTLGLAALTGCGGTFTKQGEPSGTGGSSSFAGTRSAGGGEGGISSGGDGVSYAGTLVAGGSNGGTASTGGAVSHGGDAGAESCNRSPPPATPYTVKFVYTTNTPVYVRHACSPPLQIFDCSSWSTPLITEAFCEAECGSNTCVTCGSCPLTEDLVAPGMPLSDVWSGLTYTDGMSSGCSCVNTKVAPPGVYMVMVTRYLTQEDAASQTNGYPTSVRFTLPAPNDTVTIDLGFQPL